MNDEWVVTNPVSEFDDERGQLPAVAAQLNDPQSAFEVPEPIVVAGPDTVADDISEVVGEVVAAEVVVSTDDVSDAAVTEIVLTDNVADAAAGEIPAPEANVSGDDVSDEADAAKALTDEQQQNAESPERAGLPAIARGRSGLADADAALPVVATPQPPVQVILDPRVVGPTAVPRTMQWTVRQLLQVLIVAGVIAACGLIAGWNYGGTKDDEFAARSEFIYFLEDAVPDGFLREDRRILTQLVTIESETSLRPIAAQFDTTVKDLREAMTVEVIDLSEVIRLDVLDPDPLRALAINEAVLARYQELAAIADERTNDSSLVDRRDAILEQLEEADAEVAVIAEAELSDVALQVEEESLTRELEGAILRADRLSSIADGLLTDTTTVDDDSTLRAGIAASRQRLSELEAELLQIRTERATLQREIAAQLASETPFSATANQQRDVTLGVREDSVQVEITTESQRIINFESALASSSLDNVVAADDREVNAELVATRTLISELEDQLLDVRTRRAELAQSAATRPSLLRKIERLEQDLSLLDGQIASSAISAGSPSPVEVLTEPVVLAEAANNPKLTWAALGLLASLPVAALVAALLRQRQRKKSYR